MEKKLLEIIAINERRRKIKFLANLLVLTLISSAIMFTIAVRYAS